MQTAPLLSGDTRTLTGRSAAGPGAAALSVAGQTKAKQPIGFVLAVNRAQFYYDIAAGPFYGYIPGGRSQTVYRHQAPGNDGLDQGPSRRDRRVLADRFH
jgi:hypothetical protein